METREARQVGRSAVFVTVTITSPAAAVPGPEGVAECPSNRRAPAGRLHHHLSLPSPSDEVWRPLNQPPARLLIANQPPTRLLIANHRRLFAECPALKTR